MSAESWGISAEQDPEKWDSMHASRAEAVDAGREKYGGAFYVQGCIKPRASMFIPPVEAIVDCMADTAHTEAGPAAEGFPEVSDDAAQELEDFFTTWADKHCAVDFWIAVGDPEKIDA